MFVLCFLARSYCSIRQVGLYSSLPTIEIVPLAPGVVSVSPPLVPSAPLLFNRFSRCLDVLFFEKGRYTPLILAIVLYLGV